MSRLRLFSCLALSALPASTFAGSFYLPASDGVVNLGRASAGRSAVGYDATSVFSNPAALTQLEGTQQWTVGITPLYIDNVMRDRGSKVLDALHSGGPTFVDATGTDSANGSAFNALPTLAWARRIGGERNIWIGAGVQTPYGLGLTYDGPEKFRYDTDEVRLKVIDASAVIGFKLADTLSLGGGINVQYTNAHLVQAVPGLLSPGSTSTDGQLSVRGDNTDLGFNIGLHYRPVQDWQFGLHYRSSIDNNVKGTTVVSGISTTPLAGFLIDKTYPTVVTLKYPGSVAAAAAWQTTDALQLLAEVRWFEWSHFDELRFKLRGAAVPLVRNENYRDAWSGAIGAEYRIDPQWTIRTGYMLETTPTVNANRSVAVPDANRHLFSVGASWSFESGWAADMAYQFIKWETVNINRNDGLSFVKATGNPEAHFLGIALRRIY